MRCSAVLGTLWDPGTTKRQESVYKALEQVMSINTSHKGRRGKIRIPLHLVMVGVWCL